MLALREIWPPGMLDPLGWNQREIRARLAIRRAFFICPPLHVQRKTMNIFEKLGVKIADFGKWFAGAAKSAAGLALRVESILKSEKPLEQPFVSGLSTVMADLEVLIAAAQPAVSAEGLNFAADSKVYQDFLTLVDDFKKLAPVVEEAIAALLQGKSSET